MTLASFNLTEPIVTAMVKLLSQNLNATITTLNETLTDSYTVPQVAQFLPFLPVPSTLEGGMPAVGVQELGAVFEDDQVSSTNAVHTYAVIAILNHVDQQTLAWQLRRMMEAIAYTIQADRLLAGALGTGSIMETAGAFSVNLIRYDPGPVLGEFDPLNTEGPPTSYLSWVSLVMQSMRNEQPGL